MGVNDEIHLYVPRSRTKCCGDTSHYIAPPKRIGSPPSTIWFLYWHLFLPQCVFALYEHLNLLLSSLSSVVSCCVCVYCVKCVDHLRCCWSWWGFSRVNKSKIQTSLRVRLDERLSVRSDMIWRRVRQTRWIPSHHRPTCQRQSFADEDENLWHFKQL